MTDECRNELAAEYSERRRMQQEADLRTLLSTAGGRRVLWHVLNDVAGFMNLSFTGDAQQTAFREGRRSVGLDVMVAAQRVDASAYAQMISEQVHAQQLQQLQREKAAEAAAEEDD